MGRMRVARLAAAGLISARVAVLLAPVLITPAPARAQLDSREAISLQQQILELRHEMQQGQVQQGGGNAAPLAPPAGDQAASPGDTSVASGLTPQLLERIATLEEQVRSLRGQVDQLNNQVQQQNAALAKQISDLSFNTQQAHPPPPVAAAPPPPPPELLLQHADAALSHRDYATAEADARAVMNGPKTTLHTEAEFLLSQSLSGQRQYQQAAADYYDVYSHAPRGARAPDALLGVAGSLLALGDKGDACQALRKLHAEFPQPPARVRGGAASLQGRAGCR